jgi:hypothetical protein
MSRTKDMCIIAKACNYKALRQIKSRPQEGAIDLKVRLLKAKNVYIHLVQESLKSVDFWLIYE